MKRRIFCCLSMLTIFITLSAIMNTETVAKNSVTGTLTVNKEIFQLKHAYVYEQEDEAAVFFIDNPVSQDNVPFDLGDLAYEDKIHGFSIGISKSKKQPINDSANNAVYHTIMLGRGAFINTSKLTVKTFDENVLEATLILDKPGTFPCYSCPQDHTYLYDVTFKVDLAASTESSTKPPEIIVIGDDSSAGKAYASYYKAKLTGDIDEVKKWVVKDHVKDFDSEMGQMMINMSIAMDPREVKIIKTNISGNSAMLTVKGRIDSQGIATGSVKMLLENGQWKVETDKWNFAQ